MFKKVGLGLALSGLMALHAHHGVASVSIAGVEGPGAPLETTSSSTLPKGSILTYLKLDHAKYEMYTSTRDGEGKRTDYWMYGIGYGVSDAVSVYAFLPYYTKALDDSTTTSDFHDINLMGVVGFVWDEGLKLVRGNESLDDMTDWHFTAFANVTLPTGEANAKDADGNLIDPGLQTGFGAPSWMVGVSTTKWFGNAWTFVADTSYNSFLEYEYFDGTEKKFGDEVRLNAALCYKIFGDNDKKLRIDYNAEANALFLGRDKENGVAEDATGGNILYTTQGVRLFYKNSSAALGVKLPIWTDLNEEADQQGAEGKEDYRLVFTFSTLF